MKIQFGGDQTGSPVFGLRVVKPLAEYEQIFLNQFSLNQQELDVSSGLVLVLLQSCFTFQTF